MLDIREIPIADIHPAEYNPRQDLTPEDRAYKKLKKALNNFGLVEPLVWNKRTGNLVGGHQRFKILRERGDATVPCSVVDLNDRDERALNLALNKQSGAWDIATLADLLKELDSSGLDLEVAGFDAKEFEELAPWSADGEVFQPVGANVQGRLDRKALVTCPKCNHEFEA